MRRNAGLLFAQMYEPIVIDFLNECWLNRYGCHCSPNPDVKGVDLLVYKNDTNELRGTIELKSFDPAAKYPEVHPAFYECNEAGNGYNMLYFYMKQYQRLSFIFLDHRNMKLFIAWRPETKKKITDFGCEENVICIRQSKFRDYRFKLLKDEAFDEVIDIPEKFAQRITEMKEAFAAEVKNA